MDFKNKVWKYLTALLVLLIILNPELAQLAFFIDAIGLEMFLMLLEVQLIAFLGVFFNSKLKPIYLYVRHLFFRCLPIDSWKNLVEKPESLLLIAPGPAILMNTLVISAAIGIVLNVF